MPEAWWVTSSDRRPDEVAAGISALGPELDDVVGGSDDVGVGGEEFLDVVEVEAGGGLVEDEEDGLVGLAGASGGTGTGWGWTLIGDAVTCDAV